MIAQLKMASLKLDRISFSFQITPQRVRMRLRVGQEARLTFQVAQAKQYPVDLYYLMDLSNSMSDDKDNVVKLGDQLAYAIREEGIHR